MAVQVNGKTRNVIEIKSNLEKNAVIKLAKTDKKTTKYLENKIIVKEIYVPNKIVNFVVK